MVYIDAPSPSVAHTFADLVHAFVLVGSSFVGSEEVCN